MRAFTVVAVRRHTHEHSIIHIDSFFFFFFVYYIIKASKAVGITTLPEILQEDMVQDTTFLLALYHILLNVHVVEGILVCPVTQQQFVISNEIPNFIESSTSISTGTD